MRSKQKENIHINMYTSMKDIENIIFIGVYVYSFVNNFPNIQFTYYIHIIYEYMSYGILFSFLFRKSF